MLLSSVITEITIISLKILHLLNFTLSPRERGKKKKNKPKKPHTLLCTSRLKNNIHSKERKFTLESK